MSAHLRRSPRKNESAHLRRSPRTNKPVVDDDESSGASASQNGGEIRETPESDSIWSISSLNRDSISIDRESLQSAFVFIRSSIGIIILYVAFLAIIAGLFLDVVRYQHAHAAYNPHNFLKSGNYSIVQQDLTNFDQQLKEKYAQLLDLSLEEKKEKSFVGFRWMFSNETTAKVSHIHYKRNQIVREMQDISEQINLHWRDIKAVEGPYSWLFVKNILHMMEVSILKWITGLLQIDIMFSLLSLIVLGPVAIGLQIIWLMIGYSLLPVLLTLVSIQWAVNFPEMLVFYQPSILAFLCICGGFFTFLLILVRGAWRLCGV